MSIDDINTTQTSFVVTNTHNDSNVKEVLPTVAQQQKLNQFNQTKTGFGVNTKTITANSQMRHTMFNNNFMGKVRTSNAGHKDNNKFNTYNQYEGVEKEGPNTQLHTSHQNRNNSNSSEPV